MKYFIFILSLISAISIIIKVVGLHINYSHLTRYGYGFMTGYAILLLISLAFMFFSARKIYKSLSAEV